MPTKKTGAMGRGLSAILGDFGVENVDGNANLTSSVSFVPIDKIDTNPFQPRKEFNQEALDELAQSISRQGVITPITVRKMPDDRYQLIAGERRLRASKQVGLKEIPAYVRVATDGQMMEMALVENIQRENLNAMEVAFSYNALLEECQLTHEQLSERVGKNRSTITNYLRLLNLPAETQIALSEDKISMAHARALINVEDPEQHIALLHEVISRQLSVHQTEQLAKSCKKPKPVSAEKPVVPQNIMAGQQSLKKYLQSEVDVKRSRRGKGTLTIHFNNDADFQRIMSLLVEKKSSE
ncbi:MAG: ParB/RepB/Spo0J family partition protein [Bacteroidales bacterium]|nr:ParB/RepB/Spo0J family partition protein [Candidatus Colimorpha pelethequi]